MQLKGDWALCRTLAGDVSLEGVGKTPQTFLGCLVFFKVEKHLCPREHSLRPFEEQGLLITW